MNLPNITIPIDGKLRKLSVEHVQLDFLVTDEDNPRIGLFKDNQPKNNLTGEEIRYAIMNKSPDAYFKLKDAVHNNRGIINPIWIEPINAGKYRVIEGNTRVLIYQDLNNQEPNEQQWKSIIAYILPQGVNEDEKNFIRLQAHLRGTNDWDAYEKAKYLFKLSKEDYWPLSKIEKQTKLNKHEIEQNIQAYEIMQNQYLPTHPEPNEVSKFSYFVEYVKDKKLQKAMEKNAFQINNFCDWVGDKNKIPTGQDVRHLRDILEDKNATESFISKGYEESMLVLSYSKPDITNPFYRDIERVVEKLKELTAFEMNEIANEAEGGKLRMIKELAKWSKTILSHIEDRK
jgi:hypothetical protein